MKAIPKKYLDLAMSIILDFNASKKDNEFIMHDYLYHHGFPKDVDAEQTVKILASKGLLKYDYIDSRTRDKFISVTDAGLHYFEDQAEEKRMARHEWRIAIFSALAGALVSEPLWALIRWIFDLLQKISNQHP